MRDFMTLDLKGPATMEAVLEAVVRLSTMDEATVLELVSQGRLSEAFPFRPSHTEEHISDFATEDEIVEASSLPLSREDRAMLIQSSMPISETAKVKPRVTGVKRERKTNKLLPRVAFHRHKTKDSSEGEI